MINYAQHIDTLPLITLQPGVITSYKTKPSEETAQNLSSFCIDSLDKQGNYNLTDLLEKNPGINMLSTGLAITEPVMRRLYGNKVLVLHSGLEFNNQQWQEEHGLGLSDFGLSNVELIKGPMSVLYGIEAMGGPIKSDRKRKTQNK